MPKCPCSERLVHPPGDRLEGPCRWSQRGRATTGCLRVRQACSDPPALVVLNPTRSMAPRPPDLPPVGWVGGGGRVATTVLLLVGRRVVARRLRIVRGVR